MKKSQTRRAKARAPFIHLDQSKRDRMEILLREKERQKNIAGVLKVDPSTISRERNNRKRKNGYYDADTAQAKADAKRSRASYRGKKVEKNEKLKEYIIENLKARRSPDEISGRMKQEKKPFYAGKDAIYDWLRSAYGQRYCRYLCTKRYRKRKQKKKTKREMIPNRISLKQRPKRGEHAEGDLFVSPSKLGTPASGALVVVPSAKFLAGEMIPNRKPHTMTEAMRDILAPLSVDDMTLDNGIENKGHEVWGISAYFADPHAPWQKPHVENNIGLVRRWFIPKGTDLRNISNEMYQEILHILNGKWRKSLGYRSAYEVALERGIIQEIPKIAKKYYR
ncbi:IS30 family transposase [bacterium]|nr:IS30 family transposase [bacterium]MCI0566349.1 IS30 family transposase [bacterium]